MIAREGVGEGEREGDKLLRGLSPQTKNAGYVPACEVSQTTKSTFACKTVKGNVEGRE